MRVTTAIWFAIFLRNETARGAYVTVARQGAQQAGAVFIAHNHLDGTLDLYGPAPQAFFEDAEEADRSFEKVLSKVDQNELDLYMDKQLNFDPDLWLIETESGLGEPSLSLV